MQTATHYGLRLVAAPGRQSVTAMTLLLSYLNVHPPPDPSSPLLSVPTSTCWLWLGGNYNIQDNDSNEPVEADCRSQYIIFRANQEADWKQISVFFVLHFSPLTVSLLREIEKMIFQHGMTKICSQTCCLFIIHFLSCLISLLEQRLAEIADQSVQINEEVCLF